MVVGCVPELVICLPEHQREQPAVGSALRARYLVLGSVRRAGTMLRMTAELVDTSTGETLWLTIALIDP